MKRDNIYPAISVVTVCKNDPQGLRRTIASVAEQTYSPIEHIVVNGGSDDNTLTILEEYRPCADHIISEPDLGLYDAMNKGIAIARGEWLIFLNSGDEFYQPNTLLKIWPTLATIPLEKKICVGGVKNVYPSGFSQVRLPRGVDLKRGMRFSHQSTFIRRSFHAENPYLLSDGMAADYAFFLRAAQKNVEFFLIEDVISTFEVNGVSSQSYIRNILSEAKLYKKYCGGITPKTFYLRLSYATLATLLKYLLPHKTIDMIRSIK